ncbi:hypothetical protein [Herpetosiphon gulosus]|uniref:Uncharacterized protein n=1 Tax=Herpetosiphon gulosus TaxID=1973496 RepID=A0ABP9X823_9CHLR
MERAPSPLQAQPHDGVGQAQALIQARQLDRAQRLLADRMQHFKDFAALQPDHPFTQANPHMKELTAQTTWNATGLLSMTGVLWWALNLTVDLAFPHTVVFNATGGPDVSFAIFTSVVTGFFFVDPATLRGEYQFTMQSVAGGLGEVSLDLYTMNWSQVASFWGAVGGISLSKVSGTGTLTYR